MGAFVAAAVADLYPGRVDRAVLVDGGVAFGSPVDTDIDAALTAVIGPAMTRLSMSFESVAEFVAFMARNPAVGGPLAAGGSVADDLLGYLRHDLIDGPEGRLVSSCVLDAIRADGGAVLLEPAVVAAVGRLRVPTTLLFAGRGMFDESPGLYTSDVLTAAALPEPIAVERSRTATTTRSCSTRPHCSASWRRWADPRTVPALFPGIVHCPGARRRLRSVQAATARAPVGYSVLRLP